MEPSAREVSPLGAKSGHVAIRAERNRDLFDLERQSWAFSTFWAASGGLQNPACPGLFSCAVACLTGTGPVGTAGTPRT
jgi:hypothetical protein